MSGGRSITIVLGVAATGLLAGCHMHFHGVSGVKDISASHRSAAAVGSEVTAVKVPAAEVRLMSGIESTEPQLFPVPPATSLPDENSSFAEPSLPKTPQVERKPHQGLLRKLFSTNKQRDIDSSVRETTVVLKIDAKRLEELPPAPRAVDTPAVIESPRAVDITGTAGQPLAIPKLPVRIDVGVKKEPIADGTDSDVIALPPAPGVEVESPIIDALDSSAYPIDLPAVLLLAGGQNLDVHLAAERITEAKARLTGAEWMWLPSISIGASYTRHEGEIQGTTGEVINVNRNALFVGGGARVGDSPLAGGGGGPARLFVDLSLTDAIYRPLVERQRVATAQARHTAAYHETLESAAKAYFELVRAQGRAANAQIDVSEGRELLQVIRTFVEAGKGTQADITRMKTEVSMREQKLIDALMEQKIASAQLCRLLRLDPETRLVSIDKRAIKVEMVSGDAPLTTLVTQAVNRRPDLVAKYRELCAMQQMEDAEFARPFLPNLYLGQSGGLFGGGPSSDLSSLDVRQDFDAMAVWSIKNLGLGVRSARREAASRVQQAVFDFHILRDTVKMEVAQAYHQVQAYEHKIRLAERNVAEAIKSQEQQTARIRGMAGLPLESLASLKAVSETRTAHLNAIIDFNQAHVALLKAIGMSQDVPVAVEIQVKYNDRPIEHSVLRDVPGQAIR